VDCDEEEDADEEAEDEDVDDDDDDVEDEDDDFDDEDDDDDDDDDDDEPEMVTVAVPDTAVLAADIAVIVTVAGLGTVEGAVYTPLDVMVPTVALPPATPLTSHVDTAVFVVFATVTVKAWAVFPVWTL
jgi:hypothetical protein